MRDAQEQDAQKQTAMASNLSNTTSLSQGLRNLRESRKNRFINRTKPPLDLMSKLASRQNMPKISESSEVNYEDNVQCANYKLRNIIYTALFASILYDEYVFKKKMLLMKVII